MSSLPEENKLSLPKQLSVAYISLIRGETFRSSSPSWLGFCLASSCAGLVHEVMGVVRFMCVKACSVWKILPHSSPLGEGCDTEVTKPPCRTECSPVFILSGRAFLIINHGTTDRGSIGRLNENTASFFVLAKGTERNSQQGKQQTNRTETVCKTVGMRFLNISRS